MKVKIFPGTSICPPFKQIEQTHIVTHDTKFLSSSGNPFAENL
jgi:hypothetical protein